MFCETDIILQNIPSYKLNVRIFHKILSIPHNIVMDPNNVMSKVGRVYGEEPGYHLE